MKIKKRLVALAVLAAMALSIPCTNASSNNVFKDDFSSGDLSKWTADTAFSYDATSGAMKIDSQHQYAYPNNVNANKNIAIEFDFTGSAEQYVRFKSPDGSAFSILLKNGSIELTNYMDGGAVFEPICNTWPAISNLAGVKIELANGTLKLYSKEKGTERFMRHVSMQHTLIDSNKEYLPGFWALSSDGNIVDNVKIYSPNVEESYVDKLFFDFSSEEQLADWNTYGVYKESDESYPLGDAYMWNQEGKVYFYRFNDAVMPKNNLSAKQLKVKFTLDTTSALNKNLWLEFRNINDNTDFFRVKLENWRTEITDGTEYYSFNDALLSTNVSTDTFVYELGTDSLKITRESDGTAAVLNGENFNKVFTSGAEYCVGIYNLEGYNSENPIWIHNFSVEKVVDFAISSGLYIKDGISFDFSSEEQLAEWDTEGMYSTSDGKYPSGDAYMWNQEGKVYFYRFNSAVMPKNNLSAKQLKVKLTLDTTSALNKSLWLEFRNINDNTDFFRVKLENWRTEITDGTEYYSFNDALLSTNVSTDTFVYELGTDSLKITRESDGTAAVLNGENFNKVFTSGAEYCVGIYNLQTYDLENPIWIHNFSVESEDEGDCALADSIKPGATYQVTATVEERTGKEFNGKFIAALYDRDKLVEVSTVGAENKSEIYVPATILNPTIRLFTWDSMDNISPIANQITYSAE